MHRSSKATTDDNRRMIGTTATTSNHKSNQRKIHDDKFALQKKCISIDMKVDAIDMSAYDATTLDDLYKHRSELNEQNLLHNELVRTIFTQKNVEQSLIAIVKQLGEKIEQYDDKILKKIKILKQNGIPIDWKQSKSLSSSTTTTSTSTLTSTSPLLLEPTLLPNPSSSGSESRSSSPSRPPPPSKDKSWSNYFNDPKLNRKEIENLVPSNRHSYKSNHFNEFEQILKNRNKFFGFDSNFDDEHFIINVRLANGGDLIFDDNPDPTTVESCVANPATDWPKNMKNFIRQYHQLPAHHFIDQFQKSLSHQLLFLSLDNRIKLFNSMLDELASNYPDEHDQLIVPFIKIAEIIRISRPQLHIMEWARDKIFAGIYSDIVDYRHLHRLIDQRQNQSIKSTLKESLEIKKLESLKCYRGTLNLIGTIYNESISTPNKDIFEIFCSLSKHSTKQNREIYLELLTDFILLVGPKYFSSLSKGNDEKYQMDRILMEFKHSKAEYPDHLKSKRTMVINMIENKMIRRPNNL
uniref:Uncharacterized protein LOC113794808 n=1 Tax=Dermatophagoides pteronyssinus TaxID=6956 RepID=A0A6P6Y5S3_DERPT|nr:uncharacterized protein LOC113794808 [Dermatophagoides pteronyssinus]